MIDKMSPRQLETLNLVLKSLMKLTNGDQIPRIFAELAGRELVEDEGGAFGATYENGQDYINDLTVIVSSLACMLGMVLGFAGLSALETEIEEENREKGVTPHMLASSVINTVLQYLPMGMSHAFSGGQSPLNALAHEKIGSAPSRVAKHLLAPIVKLALVGAMPPGEQLTMRWIQEEWPRHVGQVKNLVEAEVARSTQIAALGAMFPGQIDEANEHIATVRGRASAEQELKELGYDPSKLVMPMADGELN